MKPTTVLIQTHEKDGEVLLPHITRLVWYNPYVSLHGVVHEDSPNGKRDNWKNSDRYLRRFWQEHSNEVDGDVIAVIEWDTLVNCEFPDLPDEYDLVGGQLIQENVGDRGCWVQKVMRDPTWEDRNWYWWNEIPLLELPNDFTAIGLVSFGMMIMRRSVLDCIADPKWDAIFEKQIQNELRFPTIAKLCGHRVGQIHLPKVHFNETQFDNQKEIYHSVKYEQPFL